ncbi:unnamed protein product [Durusdinium trenchii]|uniref:Uncharacterized protein n=1 Tax=Durusdinium trenchii TaxID=1381693 RepID=A0ABP0L584_9DINO
MGCGGSSEAKILEAKYAASYQAVTGTATQAAPKAPKAEPAKTTEPEAATQQPAASSQASTETGPTVDQAETVEPEDAPLAWWSLNSDWIRDSSQEILAAYNFFFEHIGIRKGWRQPPFKWEDVQGPFMASAEVVAVVRHRIDELGQGMVLRQLEGSSHDFLWGWAPEKPPSQAPHLKEFFRGLVFATMSDANGLVEGLDTEFLDYYVQSHPILESATVLQRIVTADVLKTGPDSTEEGPSHVDPEAKPEPTEPVEGEVQVKPATTSEEKKEDVEAAKPEDEKKDEGQAPSKVVADAQEPAEVVEEAKVTETKVSSSSALAWDLC